MVVKLRRFCLLPNQIFIVMKKYNSRHIFDSLKDACKFQKALKKSGFRYEYPETNGGCVYINDEGYRLFICVM